MPVKLTKVMTMHEKMTEGTAGDSSVDLPESAFSKASLPELVIPSEREWAYGLLKIEESEENGELSVAARQQIFRYLADEELVPDYDVGQAISVFYPLGKGLSGASETSACESYLSAVEQQITEQIDLLTSHFFSLGLLERRRCWEQLRGLEPLTPRHRVRLDRLEIGLNVVRPDRLDESKNESAYDLNQLIECICELFVLTPLERAPRILRELDSMSSMPKAWSRAAVTVKKKYSPIAKLLPEFVADVIKQSRPQKQFNEQVEFGELHQRGKWKKYAVSNYLYLFIGVVFIVGRVVFHIVDIEKTSDNKGYYNLNAPQSEVNKLDERSDDWAEEMVKKEMKANLAHSQWLREGGEKTGRKDPWITYQEELQKSAVWRLSGAELPEPSEWQIPMDEKINDEKIGEKEP